MPDVAVCIVHLSDVFSSSQNLWGSAFCNMSLIACYWLLLTVSLFVVCVSCFCFVFSFMLNTICLLKCLISLCSSWTDRETNYVLPFVVFIVYCFVSRLRYRPPSEFSSDIQCLRVHQQVQIRWLHGPAARQVVQSGSVWEPCVRRYWGQCDSSTPVWPWPPVPSCCWCRAAQRSDLRCFHEMYFISTFSKPTEQTWGGVWTLQIWTGYIFWLCSGGQMLSPAGHSETQLSNLINAD